MKCITTIFLITIAVVVPKAFGQLAPNSKQQVQIKQEIPWVTSLNLMHVSSNEKWIVYKEKRDNMPDVVKLQHISNNTMVTFITPTHLNFSKNSKWFAGIEINKNLKLINLQSLDTICFKDVSNYKFSANDSKLIIQQNSNNHQAIIIYNLSTNSRDTIPNAQLKLVHTKLEQILFVQNKSNRVNLATLNLNNAKEIILDVGTQTDYKEFSWNQKNQLVFIATKNQESKMMWIDNGQKIELTDQQLEKILKSSSINPDKPLQIVGDKVYFYRKVNKSKTVINDNFEVWETSEYWNKNRINRATEAYNNGLLTLWQPILNKIEAIETAELPRSFVNTTASIALLYNPINASTESEEFETVMLFKKSIHTPIKPKPIAKINLRPSAFSFSPKRNFLAYFMDGNWYILNVITETITKCTTNPKSEFQLKRYVPSQSHTPRQFASWTHDEKGLLIHDANNVWYIDNITYQAKNITNSNAPELIYTVANDYQIKEKETESFQSQNQDAFFFLVTNTKTLENTWAKWETKGKLTSKPLEREKIDNLILRNNGNTIYYVKQSATMSPVIAKHDFKNKTTKQLQQSNLHKIDRLPMKTEIIKYNIDGIENKGTLVYPSNYQPSKIYPMIVEIYESLASNINKFIAPSLNAYNGFNASIYYNNDYFVLWPDIHYTIGNPGESALKSIHAVLNETLKNVTAINPNKVGIIGHSFGGYQAAYIASNSNKFAAAVVGAGIADLVMHYHSINLNDQKSEMWRFEQQQFRMGVPFYSHQQQYLENSPIYNVQNLNTPVLIWSGNKDHQVHYSQSIGWYNAVKRANKPAKLILINHERHHILNSINQRNLSIQIKDWFDKYLK